MMSSTQQDRPSSSEHLAHGPVLAAHWKRVLAFMLDLILVTLVAVVVVFQFWLPYSFSESWGSFLEKVEALQATAESLRGMELSSQEQDMLAYGELVILGIFWVYFWVSEFFFRGASLGKQVFRLRVMSLQHEGPLSFWECVVRAFVKMMTLLVLFPLLQISYLLAFFTSRRQAGHDFICRTCVVEDYALEIIDKNSTSQP